MSAKEGRSKNMARVEVTVEKVYRVAMEFEATEEQIESLRYGDNPFSEIMEPELANGDVEYDFAAVNTDTGEQIMDWN